MFGTTTILAQTLAHIQIDWFIVAVLFILSAFDGYQSGGARASAAAIALPLSIIFSNTVASTLALGATLHTLHAEAYPTAVIGVLFVIFYLIINRMIEPSFGAGGIISALLAGAGGVVVLLDVWIGTPILDTLFHFGPFPQFVFSETYRLYFVIGGYIALAFARG